MTKIKCVINVHNETFHQWRLVQKSQGLSYDEGFELELIIDYLLKNKWHF